MFWCFSIFSLFIAHFWLTGPIYKKCNIKCAIRSQNITWTHSTITSTIYFRPISKDRANCWTKVNSIALWMVICACCCQVMKKIIMWFEYETKRENTLRKKKQMQCEYRAKKHIFCSIFFLWRAWMNRQDKWF